MSKTKTVEEFVKEHFKTIENETWFPAIVAIAEGYAKHCLKKKKKKKGKLKFQIDQVGFSVENDHGIITARLPYQYSKIKHWKKGDIVLIKHIR